MLIKNIKIPKLFITRVKQICHLLKTSNNSLIRASFSHELLFSRIKYFPNLFLPLCYFKRCLFYFWHLFLLVKQCWSQPLCLQLLGQICSAHWKLQTSHPSPPPQTTSGPNSLPLIYFTLCIINYTTCEWVHHLDPIRIISIVSLNIKMGRNFQNLLKLFKAFKHTRYQLTYLPTNCKILNFSTLPSIERTGAYV